MQIRYCESCGAKLPALDAPAARGKVDLCEKCASKQTQVTPGITVESAQPISRKSSATRLSAIKTPPRVQLMSAFAWRA